MVGRDDVAGVLVRVAVCVAPRMKIQGGATVETTSFAAYSGWTLKYCIKKN